MLSLKPRARVVRFSCRPEDDGVIPPPQPAKAYLPDWFRRLPAVDASVVASSNSGLTIKRCMPFLDAMTTGWIIPLAATVRLEIKDGGAQVDAGWDFPRTMVSNHGAHQVKGHPKSRLPPCKFHNHWTITTPPGWSCLFVDPLNRPNSIFEIVAGIVDTDAYPAEVHFPFFAHGADGVHVIEKGAPIAHVIPFRRDDVDLRAVIGPETEAEKAARTRVERSIAAGPGWYREEARAKRS